MNDRVVVFEGLATRHEADPEGPPAPGATADAGPTPALLAARHWLTAEWPASELDRALPA